MKREFNFKVMKRKAYTSFVAMEGKATSITTLSISAKYSTFVSYL